MTQYDGSHEDEESLFEDLGVFAFSGHLVDQLMRGADEANFRSEVLSEFTAPDTYQLGELLQVLTKWRDHPHQDEFWYRLSDQGRSPRLFQVFCYALLIHSDPMASFGSQIYATLLGMHPVSLT
jgi:hypothetical protein